MRIDLAQTSRESLPNAVRRSKINTGQVCRHAERLGELVGEMEGPRFWWTVLVRQQGVIVATRGIRLLCQPMEKAVAVGRHVGETARRGDSPTARRRNQDQPGVWMPVPEPGYGRQHTRKVTHTAKTQNRYKIHSPHLDIPHELRGE
jgi:hypothetical protein